MSETSAPAMLTGAKAIAGFMSVTPRQVYHWAENMGLPTFKVGQLLCARPAALRAWLVQQEAKGRANG